MNRRTRMIKLFHIADLHINMENYGRIDTKTGLNLRFKDFLHTLDQMIDTAIAERIDALIIAGDLFRNRNPSQTHQKELAKRINRLSACEIETLMITGNHDVGNGIGKAHVAEVYDVLDIPHIHIFKVPPRDGKPIQIKTKSGTFQFIPLPYMSKSVLLRQKKYKNLPINELNRTFMKEMSDVLRAIIAQADSQLPLVVSAHYSLIGAKMPTGREVQTIEEMALPVETFIHPQIDYVALGHIHKFQVLHEMPPIVYAGSIDRIDFGEEKEPKGYVAVNLERGNTTYSFQRIPTRPFITVNMTLLNDETPTEALLKQLEEINIKDAIVRVKLKTTQEIHRLIDYKAIHKFLEERAFYVASISKEWVQQVPSIRISSITEKTNPMEALAEYLSRSEQYEGLEEDMLQEAKMIEAALRDEMLNG